MVIHLIKRHDSGRWDQPLQESLQLKALFPFCTRDDVSSIYPPYCLCGQRDAICGRRLQLRFVLDYIFRLTPMDTNSLADFADRDCTLTLADARTKRAHVVVHPRLVPSVRIVCYR